MWASAHALRAYLEANFPALTDEARAGFAIQIALANYRAEEQPVELGHIFGGRSSN